MDKQVVTMAVVTVKEGLVERIGHSTITQWAEEKSKKQEGKAL